MLKLYTHLEKLTPTVKSINIDLLHIHMCTFFLKQIYKIKQKLDNKLENEKVVL